jgi:hypothetical protein
LTIMQAHTVEDFGMTDDLMVSDHGRVEVAINFKDSIHRSEAGEDTVLLGVNRRSRAHARVDTGLGCGIASGTIFEQRSLKNLSDAPTVPIQLRVSLGESSALEHAAH